METINNNSSLEITIQQSKENLIAEFQNLQEQSLILNKQQKSNECIIAEFQAIGDPLEIFNNIYCTTFDDVLQSNYPTLKEMLERDIENITFVIGYISAGIESYLEFVGRAKTMNNKQVLETAGLILSECPTLQFDDIALFIRMCKFSHFGKLYDITGISLLEWLTMYVQERIVAKNDLYGRLQEEQEKARREREEAEYLSMSEKDKEEIVQRIDAFRKRIKAEHWITKPKEV